MFDFVLFRLKYWRTLGLIGEAPSPSLNFFIFMQFSAKIDQLIGWHSTHLGDGTPAVVETPNPPLLKVG